MRGRGSFWNWNSKITVQNSPTQGDPSDGQLCLPSQQIFLLCFISDKCRGMHGSWRGLEKVFVRGDGSVEKEGQLALLQLLSHLPSLTDDNTAFLLASGGRARMNLLRKPVSGSLCTTFYIVSFKKPQIFGGFGLHLVMLLFLTKMLYCIKYLKKSRVNIVDSLEHLSCTCLLLWLLFHMYLI